MNDEQAPIWDDDPVIQTRTVDRKLLLLILGGMAALAVTLSVLRSRMTPKAPGTYGAPIDLPLDADWRVSLQHAVDTFDFRSSGHEQRLANLQNEIATLRIQLAAPAVAVDANGNGMTQTAPPAAVSMPALVTSENDEAPPLMVERIPPGPDALLGEEHPVIAPAATSLMPGSE